LIIHLGGIAFIIISNLVFLNNHIFSYSQKVIYFILE